MVASSNYIEQFGTPADLQQISQHQLVMQAKGKNEWQTLFSKSNLDVALLNTQLVSSNLAKLEAVKLGLGIGIGIIPDYLLDDCDDNLVIITGIDLTPVAEELYLIYEKRRQYESKIKWLMTELAHALNV